MHGGWGKRVLSRFKDVAITNRVVRGRWAGCWGEPVLGLGSSLETIGRILALIPAKENGIHHGTLATA